MRKLMTGLWLAFALCAWTGGVLQAQDAASAAEEAAVAAEEMEEEGGDITAGEVSNEGGSGSIDKAVKTRGIAVTPGARKAIEAAGGSVED